MQSAPWWGVPVLSGIFALVGVGLAQTAVWSIERRKRQHDIQQHWDRQRQACYVRFAEAAARIQLGSKPEAQDHAVIMWSTFHEISLIASLPVREAADDLLRHLVTVKNAQNNGEREKRLWGEVQEKRDAFISAVRAELGIVEASDKIVIDVTRPVRALRVALRVALEAALPFRF